MLFRSMLGIRENPELPWIVEAWIKRWLQLRKGRPGALVAVLDADLEKSDTATGMISQLKKLAAAGRLDFFVKSSHGVEAEESDAGQSKAARQFAMPPRFARRSVGRRGRKMTSRSTLDSGQKN